MVPLSVAVLALSAWGQPEYVRFATLGYCPWLVSYAPWTASVQGSHLFVIDVGGGLSSVAVADPSNPAMLTRWNSGTNLLDLAIADSRACLAAGFDGLRIIDVANPSSPSPVGVYRPGPNAFVFAVDGGGDRVYVASGTGGSDQPTFGVQVDILDITDAAQPLRLGTIPLPYEYGKDIQLIGNTVYIKADAFYAFDISDPAHPLRSGMTILPPTTGATIRAIRIANGCACVLYNARYSGGLGLYEVPHGVMPYYQFAWVQTPGNAADLWLQGHSVYLDYSPFRFDPPYEKVIAVLNASDPFHPFVAGRHELPSDKGTPQFIRVLGDYAYVGTDLGLIILKVNTDPIFLGWYQTGSQLAMVCNEAEGMRLERTGNLQNPVWQDVRAVAPNEIIYVSMVDARAFFRLVKR